MARKEHNLEPREINKNPKPMTIRMPVVFQYRATRDNYKTTSLQKQFFKIMELARLNDQKISRAEVIAILRKKISTIQPTIAEMKALGNVVTRFRAEFGVISGILAYIFKDDLRKGNGVEWFYKPLKTKREYQNVVGRHMKMTDTGIVLRDKENKELLNKSQKQIDELIRQTSQEIDAEVGFDGSQNSNNKRKRRK